MLPFADDLGEIDVAQPGSLGHRQHQGEVGADEVFTEVLELDVPFHELLAALESEARFADVFLERLKHLLAIVEAKEHQPLFLALS